MLINQSPLEPIIIGSFITDRKYRTTLCFNSDSYESMSIVIEGVGEEEGGGGIEGMLWRYK